MFSIRQQRVLIIFYLLYAVWLGCCWYIDSLQGKVQQMVLAHPDPPELPYYIEPPIDINAASAEELALLPSIGPVLSGRIITYRTQYGTFPSLQSLQQVKGIGPKTIQKLRLYLNFPDS